MCSSASPAQLRRSTQIHVRLRPRERQVLEDAAAREQVLLSEFVRRVLVDSARRRLARRGGDDAACA